MSRRDPKASGFYWLALDDGGDNYLYDRPLLVRVDIEPQYNMARIEFLDHPEHNPDGDFYRSPYNPLIDSNGRDAFDDIRTGSIHRLKGDEVRLTWLGPVKPPRLP